VEPSGTIDECASDYLEVFSALFSLAEYNLRKIKNVTLDNW